MREEVLHGLGGGGKQALRTNGEPKTCRAIWTLFAEPIIAAATRHRGRC